MFDAAREARPRFRSTTVLGWVHGGVAALGADGQVTMGEVVVKTRARKIRRLGDGQVLAGFAGAAGDALALLDRLEEQVKRHPGQLDDPGLGGQLESAVHDDDMLARQPRAEREQGQGHDRAVVARLVEDHRPSLRPAPHAHRATPASLHAAASVAT